MRCLISCCSGTLLWAKVPIRQPCAGEMTDAIKTMSPVWYWGTAHGRRERLCRNGSVFKLPLCGRCWDTNSRARLGVGARSPTLSLPGSLPLPRSPSSVNDMCA